MENSTVRTEIKKGQISLDKLFAGQYQKEGTKSAQLRQEITTTKFYPTKQVSTNLNQNIFGASDFGFTEKDYTSTETRVAWIPVPENSTEVEVKAKLDAAIANGATLYKVLHNHPILDQSQEYAIAQGITTKDTIANSQAVRYPEGHENAGQLTLDPNGKVQYRRVFFWLTPIDDQDARTSNPDDQYLTSEIASELAGASVMQGQTV
jgi:hypothetical protein